jgi:hypothetical protein
VATSTSSTTPSISTASGMALPSTSTPVNNKTYGISFLGALTPTRGGSHYCSVLTFYYAGF